MLKDENIKHLAISPEGTLKASPWRTGYFYIAKGIQYPITVGGGGAGGAKSSNPNS